MAMTKHIQGALTMLLHSWEQDETGSYKDSFIFSEACQHHVDNDNVSQVYSHDDLDLQIESAQVYHSGMWRISTLVSSKRTTKSHWAQESSIKRVESVRTIRMRSLPTGGGGG